MSKLTTTEKRAKAACDYAKGNEQLEIQVTWKKSNMWGSCPRIDWHGEKAAYASGCGYDKISAVLSEFLRWLVPDVDRCSGAGLSSVEECLLKNGWNLEHTYNGRAEDGFCLTYVGQQ